MTGVHSRAATTPRAATARSGLARAALALTALSALALVVMILGSVLDWRGFSSDPNDNSAFADVTWSIFALGGLLALITGAVAWVRGRREAHADDARAGRIAVGYVAFAIVLSVIWSAFD